MVFGSAQPRLLLVAHGTRSVIGSATTVALAHAIAHARPDLDVELCYLDVQTPSLTDALESLPGPVVVVPALLSTGYHVQQDIPAAVAGRPDVSVARHLGPHPLLVDALVDRLVAAGGSEGRATTLVGAGSSRPEAKRELEDTAAMLASRLGAPVSVATMADDLRAAVQYCDQVATYLLAEGRFTQTLADAAPPGRVVADALGTHPAVVRLVLLRYDECR